MYLNLTYKEIQAYFFYFYIQKGLYDNPQNQLMMKSRNCYDFTLITERGLPTRGPGPPWSLQIRGASGGLQTRGALGGPGPPNKRGPLGAGGLQTRGAPLGPPNNRGSLGASKQEGPREALQNPQIHHIMLSPLEPPNERGTWRPPNARGPWRPPNERGPWRPPNESPPWRDILLYRGPS